MRDGRLVVTYCENLAPSGAIVSYGFNEETGKITGPLDKTESWFSEYGDSKGICFNADGTKILVTLGRASPPPNGTDSAEIVVDLYKGTETDVDVGFWNIEWFSNRFNTKTKDVATIIADFNLDIWALSESSPAAT